MTSDYLLLLYSQFFFLIKNPISNSNFTNIPSLSIIKVYTLFLISSNSSFELIVAEDVASVNLELASSLLLSVALDIESIVDPEVVSISISCPASVAAEIASLPFTRLSPINKEDIDTSNANMPLFHLYLKIVIPLLLHSQSFRLHRI